MKYEQLKIEDHLDPLSVPFYTDETDVILDSKSNFVYLDDCVLEGNQFIACKLDYYSCVFADTSISDVISWVGLGNGFKDEFFKQQSERSSGYDDVFVFNYNGVQIDVSKFYLYGKELNISAFDIPLPKIRLNIPGKGLDYLRSIGFECDTLFRDQAYYLDRQHVTRCDFAFDFVNYKGEIIDELIDYVATNQTDSGRIVICNMSSSLRASVRTGDQKTVYFGATTSDQLLRCYDKRLQNIDRESNLYIGENPYNSPQSWVRIELQMRNKKAHNMLLNPIDFTGILHFITDYYKFADINTPAHRREQASFWVNFLNWETLPPIIQNLQNVQKLQTQREKVENSFPYWVCNFVLWLTDHRIEGLTAYINEWLHKLQDYEHSDCPPIYNKRWKAFLNKFNSMEFGISPGVARDGLNISSNNKLYFDLTPDGLYSSNQIAERYK